MIRMLLKMTFWISQGNKVATACRQRGQIYERLM